MAAAAHRRPLALREPLPVADDDLEADASLDGAGAPLAPVPGYTLLDLVRAVAEATADDGEVVATVLHLLRSGSVRLTGSFRGERF
ncbi:MAG TPA: hypothetical protein VHQ66_09325 [Myxococcota bacterium]|jgi:hypothetical protein|nr:hypothetical protein [Myxococcota bacterium]